MINVIVVEVNDIEFVFEDNDEAASFADDARTKGANVSVYFDAR